MNDEQREFWNGPAGEQWTELQTLLDERLRAYGTAVLEALAPQEGMHLLDIGCGCGDTTLSAAKHVGPSGSVVGVDLSRPMLARAQTRARGVANVRFVEGDAASFTSPRPFDGIFSRFGVMFFDDPVAAFSALRGQLAPGGRLAFVCWQSLDDNAWAKVPLAAARSVVPATEPAPPPDAPGPFALASPERIRAILSDADWADVSLTSLTLPMLLGDTVEAALDYTCQIGPASRLLREQSEADAVHVVEAIARALAPFGPRVALPSAVWIVTARRAA